MTATVFYDNVNQLAQLTATFALGGSPADPTTVSLLVTDPAGVQVTYVVTAGQITRTGTGVYTYAVSCAPAVANMDGLWSYVWIGTGAVSDVQPGTWRVLPASVGGWYIGAEELKDRLGITDSGDDSQIQIAIQSVTGWINMYCGRRFDRVTETRTFVPENIWRTRIDDVVSITAFNVDTTGSGIFDQPWIQNVDYQLLVSATEYNVNAGGIVPRPYGIVQAIQTGKWFPFVWPYTHFDRIQISGTWGWAAVPPPITQAAFILAADIFKMKDAPFGLAGSPDLGVSRINANPWLVEMLRGYMRGRKRVGV